LTICTACTRRALVIDSCYGALEIVSVIIIIITTIIIIININVIDGCVGLCSDWNKWTIERHTSTTANIGTHAVSPDFSTWSCQSCGEAKEAALSEFISRLSIIWLLLTYASMYRVSLKWSST